MAFVTVEHVNFRYPQGKTDALQDVTFSLERGECAVLCGPSGCGKSTLLRTLKPAFAPHGERRGTICLNGTPLDELDQRAQSRAIGFVGQSPENQLVTDKVWHELAFGLESLGMDPALIRSRVAETASFFGIQTWFDKEVATLSGGQKQLLNLAAVMVMEPALLLLDEPTSQLDPIAAGEFLAAVGRINHELGTTVLIVEHRLEELLPYSDRLLVMENGRLTADGTPDEVAHALWEQNSGMFASMPVSVRVWAALSEGNDRCPWSVSDGRVWLETYAAAHPIQALPQEDAHTHTEPPALEIDNVWFRYDKNAPDVLKGASLTTYPGELVTLLGGNGTGKSTLLSLMTGSHRPYRGQVRLCGQPVSEIAHLADGVLGMLPQHPQTLFTHQTVREDLWDMLRYRSLSESEREARVADMLRLCALEELAERHPYDLSGGEQQRAALAKVLLLEPQVLLLDEPTKGMDAAFKRQFAAVLYRLLGRGVAIVMVSHDVEFCARFAHRCALFFDGAVVAENTPRAFFSGNRFYTTAACRMAKTTLPGAITADDIIAACTGEQPSPVTMDEEGAVSAAPLPPTPRTPPAAPAVAAPAKGRWRRWIGGAAGLALTGTAVFIEAGKGVPAWLQGQGMSNWLLIAAILCFAVGFGHFRSRVLSQPVRPPRQSYPRRTRLAIGAVLLAIPLTLLGGALYIGDEKYLFVSLLLLFEGMLPVFLRLEGRRPPARELVLIAVLCALGVAGRSLMYILPQFKPVAALTVVAGVAFGGETGFLVGSLTMLASNVLFGQGPWTPWQMVAMGAIGFTAGVLYGRGWLRPSRLSLMAFGGLSTLLVYGGVMNASSLIMMHEPLTLPMLLAYELAGLPMDAVHALATVALLYFFAEPMLEKLERVKRKYGWRTV